jgi:hypothetical protein
MQCVAVLWVNGSSLQHAARASILGESVYPNRALLVSEPYDFVEILQPFDDVVRRAPVAHLE